MPQPPPAIAPVRRRSPPAPLFAAVLGVLVWATAAPAHQVPSMQIEVLIARTGVAKVTFNLDARSFLSDLPTSLPPVPAEWWRDQDDSAKAQTRADAAAYLRRAARFLIDDQQALPLSEFQIETVDANTAVPLSPDSTEVHLVAIGELTLPEKGGRLAIDYTRAATVAAVIIMNIEGEPETRPQVLFAGEKSRPLAFPARSPAPAPPAAALAPAHERKKTSPALWLAMAAALLGGLMVLLRKKAVQQP